MADEAAAPLSQSPVEHVPPGHYVISSNLSPSNHEAVRRFLQRKNARSDDGVVRFLQRKNAQNARSDGVVALPSPSEHTAPVSWIQRQQAEAPDADPTALSRSYLANLQSLPGASAAASVDLTAAAQQSTSVAADEQMQAPFVPHADDAPATEDGRAADGRAAAAQSDTSTDTTAVIAPAASTKERCLICLDDTVQLQLIPHVNGVAKPCIGKWCQFCSDMSLIKYAEYKCVRFLKCPACKQEMDMPVRPKPQRVRRCHRPIDGDFDAYCLLPAGHLGACARPCELILQAELDAGAHELAVNVFRSEVGAAEVRVAVVDAAEVRLAAAGGAAADGEDCAHVRLQMTTYDTALKHEADVLSGRVDEMLLFVKTNVYNTSSRSANGDGQQEQQIRSLVRGGDRRIVALMDLVAPFGKRIDPILVGVGIAKQSSRKKESWWMNVLGVLPAFRKAGLAFALLEQVAHISACPGLRHISRHISPWPVTSRPGLRSLHTSLHTFKRHFIPSNVSHACVACVCCMCVSCALMCVYFAPSVYAVTASCFHAAG